jgi:hypothetical protein
VAAKKNLPPRRLDSLDGHPAVAAQRRPRETHPEGAIPIVSGSGKARWLEAGRSNLNGPKRA